ncbi:MAG: type II toxin-antitoxin system RelE/ParE family toxin [Bacteroidota bacterium]
MRPRSIKFRSKANQDLLDIFQFSLEAFGEVQAKKYASDVLDQINILGRFPMIGISSKKSSIRILPVHQHVVVYEIYSAHLTVLRILSAKTIRSKL